jgi:hypothetical protein
MPEIDDQIVRSIIPAAALGGALERALCDMAIAQPDSWGYLAHEFTGARSNACLRLSITPTTPLPERNLDYDHSDDRPILLRVGKSFFEALEHNRFFERLHDELPGLTALPAANNPLDFGMNPVSFSFDRGQLFDAFGQTKNEIFKHRFAPVKLWGQRYAHALSLSEHSTNRESDKVAHFVAAQITDTLPTSPWLDLDCLERLPTIKDPARVLRRAKVYDRLRANYLIDAADHLKNLGISKIRFLGAGTYSLSFAAPRSDTERYVFSLSPDCDAWPDTLFHLPAFVQKDMAGGAFWKLSLELTSRGRIHYERNRLYNVMCRAGLSTTDVDIKNIGLYDFRMGDEMTCVPLIFDWGAAHENSVAQRRALADSPFLEPWRAAQRDLAKRATQLVRA